MFKQSFQIGLIAFASTIVAAQEPQTNRLASESSPYLLQHANNPVDWYPWGDEAIAKAKAEGKLIFLSIGYSACHWCHVMERESFSDAEIAAFMNEHFVCIKVDREERPDVDQIYLTAVQLVGGNAGWPLSVFLTPDTKPISGGSYFPPHDGDRGFSEGFQSILKKLSTVWRDQKPEVLAHADRVTEALLENFKAEGGDETDQKAKLLQRSIAEKTLEQLHEQFDAEFGGFGASAAAPNRPKFPEPSNLAFLIDVANRQGFSQAEQSTAREMLIKSLDSMYSGGIYDQIGGGFHRYSTDRYWRVPHFEKMLYDNAQLTSIYARAYELTGREDYRWVAEDICNFAISELSTPQGAFYASINADSEGEEGAYYRWSKADSKTVRDGNEALQFYASTYGLDGDPNFEDQYYVPQLRKTLQAIAQEQGVSVPGILERFSGPRNEMKRIREQRERPSTDTKIIASWNGLMIGALAEAGRILQRPEFVEAAEKSASFVLDNMRNDAGLLSRTYTTDAAELAGYLDDYAFVVYGLCQLHKATSEPRWLDEAIKLNALQASQFEDTKAGGYYYTSLAHQNLIVRFKDPVDGAIPSGNSVTAGNLLYLSKQSDSDGYSDSFRRLFDSEANLMADSPLASPLLVTHLQEWLSTSGASK